ncbi:MAG: bifunctional [glutamine synthetase] adenylyltransferase/[glutamine synthetase]-adenylyl-L-tyrosine phosphorylase [Bifidobacterium sp.]|jgi:glutamate-ammonia-ligase adenylyltransferase|nr:bifunctional [glutamine synthetase] adenylyltransferase/[glutamine synthetase]-adenylyl-L-tyrosine phosphorylase [Bifidobacterium sp.]MCH4174379.1 bifunctional [glutamine synthetase] adenylyltransferase/[glutamine synthetase]-adenylyl-L-tyrosine phosphorylase [Bifidobacterium sp.]
MADQTWQLSSHVLIHAGFQDLEQARLSFESLQAAGLSESCMQALLKALTRVCDPDVALQNLTSLCESFHEQQLRLHDLIPDSTVWASLLSVLGASEVVGVLMRNRPDLVKYVSTPQEIPTGQHMREALLQAVKASQESNSQLVSSLTLIEGTTALRTEYLKQLVSIMAFDTSAHDPVAIQPQVSQALSDLASAALEAALAVARNQVQDAQDCRFTVIGMGKLGARELNYVSDVDLIYVVECQQASDDHQHLIRIGSKLAMLLQKICQSVIAGVSEPALWQIDTALRPEGKDGPLVRTLQSHQDYYEQWAQNWEFQALLKARPVAGDVDLGHNYCEMAQDFVWKASQRDNFVYDCQHMRKRVEQLIPAPLKDREIKLGKGGLRDVEFTVQMLQLVHGRSDHSLRTASTIESLQALADGGYVSRAQADRLTRDYSFERVLEHRQQMWSLKRTHLFPDLGQGNIGGIERKRDLSREEMDSNSELRRLSRSFGLHADELVERFDATRREVRKLHQDIYYRPMLPISAQLEEDEISLSPQAALVRFASIGFQDPQSAMRHVQALTTGVSRAAKINKILLPAVLQWLGEGQNPDMGLLGWRTLEERFGSGNNYLGFLRDSPSAAQRLCHILANSRFLMDALGKSAESVTWLGDDTKLGTRTLESLNIQTTSARTRFVDHKAEYATSIRAMRRHEIERIGLGWMSGTLNEDACLEGMTNVYDAILDSVLTWSIQHVLNATKAQTAAANICLIAMGRYGGREVNFSSDADVIAIYRPNAKCDDATANNFARAVMEVVRAVTGASITVEPKIDLDMDLRPEGKHGPLVRSFNSCKEYYSTWSSVWEHQALLRARYAAGDQQLAELFLNEIANPIRYPRSQISASELGEIRRLKARMEAERLPRGVRRDRHLKLGKGGLSDVEWTIQLLQLQHAGMYEELHTTQTIPALHALRDLGFINQQDAETLEHGWKVCTSARNGNYLWSGRVKQADILPDDSYSLGGIAIYLGQDAHRGQLFENEILSLMRRNREVMERLFYGITA